MPQPREQQSRSQTVRQALVEALRAGPATARDLSKAVGISERDVAGHLVHLAKSLRSRGEKLLTLPARCLDCGFSYSRRERPARPSHCAACRGTRLTLPEFSIGAGRGSLASSGDDAEPED
jgi:predicted Zn-ribbon and HTH transcriptional regulator